MAQHNDIGSESEKLACEWLQSHGYEFVEANYRYKHAEIDLIMKHKGILVFVEVKYRSSDRYGSPLEGVSVHKQRRIKKIAQRYITDLGYEPVCRFDVVGIIGTEIYWVKGAFE